MGWDSWENCRCSGTLRLFALLGTGAEQVRGSMTVQAADFQSRQGKVTPPLSDLRPLFGPDQKSGWLGSVTPWMIRNKVTVAGGLWRVGHREGDIPILGLIQGGKEQDSLRHQVWGWIQRHGREWVSDLLDPMGNSEVRNNLPGRIQLLLETTGYEPKRCHGSVPKGDRDGVQTDATHNSVAKSWAHITPTATFGEGRS
jgi:hypothetical protein